MRTRFGISLFALALAASAAAHALVFATFSAIRVGRVDLPRQEAAEMAVHFEAAPPEPEPNEFDIGQPLATGYATHDLAGRQEQAAPEAPQDQARLSLDPVGTSSRVEVPSSPGDATPTAPLEVTAPPPALAADALPPMPAPPALPRGVAEQVERDRLESIADAAPVPPRADVVPTAPPSPVEVAAPAPPEHPFASAAGAGADPAPKSDSESDAFSVLGTVEFRAGRVTVRSGRQVKTRRPKIGLAGMVDLAHSRRAQVELKVAVDESGKVTNVDVARSSGSNEIDQPCRVAMYDWWFEPKKDDAGRPVPDEFRFTIAFR